MPLLILVSQLATFQLGIVVQNPRSKAYRVYEPLYKTLMMSISCIRSKWGADKTLQGFYQSGFLVKGKTKFCKWKKNQSHTMKYSTKIVPSIKVW